MSTSTRINSISDIIVERLPNRVSQRRLQHIHGVIETAVSLAERFGVDRERVRLAAAAHDMDRDLSAGAALALAADWGIPLSTAERRHPALIHGALSAERLRRQYGVLDRELLHAVRHHTLGDPSFGPVGHILYVADFCEPGRTHLSSEERGEILGQSSPESMVAATIRRAWERFGRLDTPTKALLDQVSGG
ncbi:MAG: bis(5'-nucleosyl)-tetraphosphatase (symmetrical) YqeK [Alkalispirochaeta sp.]